MATPAQLSPVTDVIAIPCPCGVAGDIAAFHLVSARLPASPRPAGALSAQKERDRGQLVLLQRHHLSPVGVRGPWLS